jgi:hypothetical protein
LQRGLSGLVSGFLIPPASLQFQRSANLETSAKPFTLRAPFRVFGVFRGSTELFRVSEQLSHTKFLLACIRGFSNLGSNDATVDSDFAQH